MAEAMMTPDFGIQGASECDLSVFPAFSRFPRFQGNMLRRALVVARAFPLSQDLHRLSKIRETCQIST
jgi:hypothetical protein